MTRTTCGLAALALAASVAATGVSSAHRYRCGDGHMLRDTETSRTYTYPASWSRGWKAAIDAAAAEFRASSPYSWRYSGSGAFTQWRELESTDPEIAGATTFRRDGCGDQHDHVRTVAYIYRNQEHVRAYDDGHAKKVCIALHEFGHASVLDHVSSTDYRSVMYADHLRRCHSWQVDTLTRHDVEDLRSLY